MDRRKRLVWGLSVNYVSLQKVDIEPALIKRFVTNALKLKQQKKKKKMEIKITLLANSALKCTHDNSSSFYVKTR